MAWFIATTSHCLFEFFKAWHLCVQVFKGFFLRPTFAVKELIQTPIEKSAQVDRPQAREERGLLVV
jgi:hypothetical protein